MLFNSNTSHTNKSIFNLYYFRYVLKHLLFLPVLHDYFCSLSCWMLACVAHLDARSSQTCRCIMRCSWRQQRMPGNLAWSGTMSLMIQTPRNLRSSCTFTPSGTIYIFQIALFCSTKKACCGIQMFSYDWIIYYIITFSNMERKLSDWLLPWRTFSNVFIDIFTGAFPKSA